MPTTSPDSTVQRCLPSCLSASSTATLPSRRALTAALFRAATSRSKSAQGDSSRAAPSPSCREARIHPPSSFTYSAWSSERRSFSSYTPGLTVVFGSALTGEKRPLSASFQVATSSVTRHLGLWAPPPLDRGDGRR